MKALPVALTGEVRGVNFKVMHIKRGFLSFFLKEEERLGKQRGRLGSNPMRKASVSIPGEINCLSRDLVK